MSEDRQALTIEALRRGLIKPEQAQRLLNQGSRSSLTESEIRPADAESQFGLPRTEPQGIWESFKSFLGRGSEALAQGAKDIGRDTLEMASDVGRSLMPTRGGAEAGGRVLGKLGDMGQFASGGLMGGLGIPGQARTALGARPPGRPVPPVPQARGPQLALPPPAPAGTMGAPMAHPIIQAAAESGTPLVSDAAKEGRPSMLATAMLNNDPLPVDRTLAKRFRGLANVSKPGRADFQGLTAQDQRITTAIDSIIDAKDSLRLKDTAGNDVPVGRLPRSLNEFVQSISHLKSQIFDAYDNMAQGQTARVPLAPAVQRLTQAATSPELAGINPAMSQKLLAQAQRWEQAGSYSPKEMQNVVQELNQNLADVIKSGGEGASSYNRVMGQALGDLRTALNQTMNQALQGPQYQNLRNRYSALTSIEGDVTNALRQQMSKRPGGLVDKLMEPMFWANAIHGVVTMDPTAIGRAAALGGAKEITKYLNSPNRAVTRMFAKRAESTPREIQQAILERNALRSERFNAAATSNLDEYQRLGQKMQGLGF